MATLIGGPFDKTKVSLPTKHRNVIAVIALPDNTTTTYFPWTEDVYIIAGKGEKVKRIVVRVDRASLGIVTKAKERLCEKELEMVRDVAEGMISKKISADKRYLVDSRIHLENRNSNDFTGKTIIGTFDYYIYD